MDGFDDMDIHELMCDDCKQYHAKFYAYVDGERRVFCGKCKYKYLWAGKKICFYCGQKFDWERRMGTVRGKYVCPTCFEEIRKGHINTYDYKKKPRSLRGKNDNIFLYG